MALAPIGRGIAVAVALFTIGTGRAVAQTSQSPVTAGVLGGINLASLSLPLDLVGLGEESGVSVENRRRIGLLAGVVIDVPIATRLAFETGAFYSEKGSNVLATVPGLGTGEADLKMIYVDVPTLARVGLAGNERTRVYLIGGATMGFRVHARTRTEAPGEATTTQDFTSEIPAFDIGLTIGGRVTVGRAMFDVRYLHGLLNLAEDDEVKIKHSVVSFMAGWTF